MADTSDLILQAEMVPTYLRYNILELKGFLTSLTKGGSKFCLYNSQSFATVKQRVQKRS